MSNNFFKCILKEERLIPNWWVDNLDWIFDSEKFQTSLGWTKGPKRVLTNYINKSISNISVIKTGDNIKLPKEGVYAIFTSDNCKCVSFFRHIRNSIAHNNTTIVMSKKQQYIRFKDYKDDSRKIQTADIMINMDLLVKIHQKYSSLKTTPKKHLPKEKQAA